MDVFDVFLFTVFLFINTKNKVLFYLSFIPEKNSPINKKRRKIFSFFLSIIKINKSLTTVKNTYYQ